MFSKLCISWQITNINNSERPIEWVPKCALTRHPWATSSGTRFNLGALRISFLSWVLCLQFHLHNWHCLWSFFFSPFLPRCPHQGLISSGHFFIWHIQPQRFVFNFFCFVESIHRQSEFPNIRIKSSEYILPPRSSRNEKLFYQEMLSLSSGKSQYQFSSLMVFFLFYLFLGFWVKSPLHEPHLQKVHGQFSLAYSIQCCACPLARPKSPF